MLKKLLATLTAFIIISCFVMTAFASNTQGSTDVANTYINNVRNSESKDLNSVGKQVTGSPVTADKINTTYTNEENERPDAEFYAAIEKVLREGKSIDNGQSILLITKPEAISGKVSIYSKKFSVSVKTEFDDVVFSVARLNETTGRYETIEFDGEKSIMVACGTDVKEVNLEYGTNQLLLISYRNSDKVESKVQYNAIVVEANKEAARDKAVTPEKPVKKTNDSSLTLETFLNNLMGKGK